MLDKLKTPAVLALGYFDSVHKGHQKVIKEAVDLAQKLGVNAVVVTFEGNLKATLTGSDEKVVYTEDERQVFYKELGAKEVFFAPTNSQFLSMDKGDFLSYLNQLYDVKGYVSGEDYRFGKNGSGVIGDVKNFAQTNEQIFKVVELVQENGEKISTTLIKKILSFGQVKRAKELLGRAYSVSGTVFSDRKMGHKLGFPTVNIKLDKRKHPLKDGVYIGHVDVLEKTYSAVINYGARPTFDLEEKLVEAHIIDFDGDLYGQTLTLCFDNYIRDVEKFNDIEQLKKQLKKDVERAKGEKYD